ILLRLSALPARAVLPSRHRTSAHRRPRAPPRAAPRHPDPARVEPPELLRLLRTLHAALLPGRDRAAHLLPHPRQLLLPELARAAAERIGRRLVDVPSDLPRAPQASV